MFAPFVCLHSDECFKGVFNKYRYRKELTILHACRIMYMKTAQGGLEHEDNHHKP